MHHLSTRRRLRAGVGALGLAAVVAAGSLLPGGGASAQEPQPTATTITGPQTVCPAAEGDARWVRFVYLNILFRCPDQAGLDHWLAKLDAGTPRSKVAEAIDLSTENLVNNNIVEIYRGILERDPSEQELAAGVAHIRKHQEDGQIIARLIASDEFYELFYDELAPSDGARDDAWLDTAYNMILDRSPDSAGAAYFGAILGSPSTEASRFRVASLLERSGENAQGWTFGVYFAGLNRPPDEAGFAYWSQWLRGPGQWRTFKMWTTVLSSNEAYARAQTQPNPFPEVTLEGDVTKVA